jgi:erythromycin esterase
MKKHLSILIIGLILSLCFTLNIISSDLIEATDTGITSYVDLQSNTIGSSYSAIVESLDNVIHPLNSSPLELSDEDLKVLSYLGDSRIVGLGEATHGTKEFFQTKHRIFTYLVEYHGFNVFAFESDMGESYYVNKFVTQGVGDLDDIMENKMLFEAWQTEEVKDLLLWMKEYNEDKAEKDENGFE